MRRYFTLIYWCAAVPLVALVLWSVMGSFGRGLFLAAMLLPGVLFFKYFAGDISFRNRRRGVLHTVYFVAIVMLIEYLGVFLVYLSFESPFTERPPGIVMNPLFLWLLLGGLLSIEYLIGTKLFKETEPARERYITFTSDRRKVSLELSRIMYVESRDSEVMVVVAGGEVYPTRMKISQWEAVLDDRFIRTHRSFIVNREHITRLDTHAVWLGDLTIEVSRKYRERVLELLEA